MKKNSCKFSIVIPCYKSESVLVELVNRIKKTFSDSRISAKSYEIIFVCDNSPDDTWITIRKLSVIHKQVRGLLLRLNVGQHNALMAGFKVAKGTVIITMDDDLQHSPSDMLLLISEIEKGADVVYANFNNRNHAFWKVIGSKFNNLVAGYLMDKPNNLYLSPYRAIKASIIIDILKYTGPYVYIDGLILTATRNIKSVTVNHYDRFSGSSSYGLRKSISLWLKMATNFSIAPLRLTSLIGIFFSFLGFMLAFLLIIQKFTWNLMPIGWSSLIVTILIVGGFQLLALGMIGEYLGRVLLTINSKPQYIISESVSIKE
jgi:glycosyltransferase involved in cell wall biosynthesis